MKEGEGGRDGGSMQLRETRCAVRRDCNHLYVMCACTVCANVIVMHGERVCQVPGAELCDEHKEGGREGDSEGWGEGARREGARREGARGGRG